MNPGEIKEILLKNIVTNPNQPRHLFNEDALLELADSISQHGLLQPIVVRGIGNDIFELIAGERRYRAFELLGLDTIPALIKNMDTKESAVLALIENIQREDLHFIEIARGYQNLIDTYQFSQNELASIVGKTQSTIANKLRVISLPEDVLQVIISNDLSERHGRALLKIKDTIMLKKAVKHIVKNNLTVSGTEKYIEHLLDSVKNDKSTKVDEKPVVKSYLKDIRLFTNTIRQAVDMINTSGVNAKYVVKEEDDKYLISIEIPIER